MLIAATLSLAIAYLARRFNVRVDQVRALSRDPRWILAALLTAAVLVLLFRALLFQAG